MSQVQLHMVIESADGLPGDDERDLVEQAKHDRQAFATLYRRHWRPLVDHVYRRTGDRHASEDLVADVFLTALGALPHYRYRGIPFRFWLLRIATNAVNRWARRQRQIRVTTLSAAVKQRPASAAPTTGDIDVERARRALLALSPKHQSVLALHYLEGLGVLEVAAILGCRVGTVKSRLARARDALRAELLRRR